MLASNPTISLPKLFKILVVLGGLVAVAMFLNNNTTPKSAILFIIFPFLLIIVNQKYKSSVSLITWYAYPTFWVSISIFMIFFCLLLRHCWEAMPSLCPSTIGIGKKTMGRH